VLRLREGLGSAGLSDEEDACEQEKTATHGERG
jgi:hypothetical protein